MVESSGRIHGEVEPPLEWKETVKRIRDLKEELGVLCDTHKVKKNFMVYAHAFMEEKMSRGWTYEQLLQYVAFHVFAGGTPGYKRGPLLDFTQAGEESVEQCLKRAIREVKFQAGIV